MKKLLNWKVLVPVISLIILVCVGYYFYHQRLIEDELPRFENAIIDNEEINQYITSLSIFKDEKSTKKVNGYRINNYEVIGKVKDEFNNLSNDEKIVVMAKIKQTLDKEKDDGISNFNCGNKNICKFKNIKLLGEIGENKINSYEVSDIDLMEDDKINMEVMYDEDGKYNPQTVSFGDSLSVSSNSSSNSTPALTLEETGCTKNYGLLKTTGFIKNNSSTSYTFVKIKVTYKDEIGNIIDTDWGYAVDSEPLYPNERKSYEILTKDNEQIKKCHQKITNEY